MAEQRRPAPYIDVKINLKDLKLGINEILSIVRKEWDLGKVQIKNIHNGFVNQNIICSYGETMKDALLMKIFGDYPNYILDIERSTKAMKVLHQTGLSPELICIFENGVAHAFQKGEALTWDDADEFLTNQELQRSTMQTMAEWHTKNVLEVAQNIGIQNIGKPHPLRDVEAMLEKWPPNINDTRLEQMPSKNILLQEFKELENTVCNMKLETVFIHGDPNPANIILREKDRKPIFIDYDTTRLGYAEWDLAFFCQALYMLKSNDESNLLPTKEWHIHLLRDYLDYRSKIDGTKNKVTNEDIEVLYVNVRKMSLSYNFYIGFICFALAELASDIVTPVDFIKLGIDKIMKYFEEKEVLMHLNA